MPGWTVDVEPGATLVVPAGASAAITVLEKSGRKAKLRVESTQPVTITSSNGAERTLSKSGPAPDRPLRTLTKPTT